MDWWQNVGGNLASMLIGAGVIWVVRDWWTAKKAKTQADTSQGLVPDEKCKACHEEWEEKLAAGDERMDVGSEVDAFVVRWLPVICESVGLDSEVCKTMRREATTLLDKVIKAGRNRTGKHKEGNHA